jgi:glycine C-acetyltransferase
MEFAKFLYKNGVFGQPIRYPTVPKKQARIRLSVTALLAKTDIERSIQVFEKAFREFLK